MAWNEPGGNQQQQNPWGKGNKPVPFDLQKFLKNLKKQFHSNGKQPTKNDNKLQKGRHFLSSYGHYLIPALLLASWLLAGVTIVDNGEQAVVLKLGQYNRNLSAGMHWLPPFFEKAYVIPQQQINAVSFTGNTVTADQQILTFTVNVQYRIADPKAYLFAVSDPEQNLEDDVAAAINQVLGAQTATAALSMQRQTLNQQLISELNQSLATVNTGFVLSDLSLQSLDVPAAVTDAHADALRAQQNAQQVLQQAQDDATQVATQAQAQADQLMASAKAYQEKVVLKAQGETARYLALLPEYQQNPQVTRERLYVAAMQHILTKVSKVLVDVPNNGHLQVNIPSVIAQPNNTLAGTATQTDADNASSAKKTSGDQAQSLSSYGGDTDANSY